MEILLEHGADIEAKTRTGETALGGRNYHSCILYPAAGGCVFFSCRSQSKAAHIDIKLSSDEFCIHLIAVSEIPVELVLSTRIPSVERSICPIAACSRDH